MRMIYLCLPFIAFAMTSECQVPTVRTGIEVLRERNFDILQGKRIGLVTNQTAVDSKLLSDIDILHQAPGVTLVALYGPEHGVRGDFAAGDRVESYTDPSTGIPVFSLYGDVRKPTPEMLQGVDVLVYDIQDNGCRSYTYISTMGLAMEAAAEQHIPFVVLDRPNPLGGLKIEGNIVEPDFISFIGQFPIPYVYGLTSGELAGLLNGEGMLANGVRCELTVVPLEGWRREMTYEETGLIWVPTSPHLPHASTAMYYVATGVLGELGSISIGIGYTLPFEIFAAEWIDPYRLLAELESLHLDGVLFRPITFTPFYGRDEGKTLRGVQIHITDPDRVNLLAIQYRLMEAHNRLYPEMDPFRLADRRRLPAFDKAAGTDQIRLEFANRKLYSDIDKYLGKDIEKFRTISQRHYLYR